MRRWRTVAAAWAGVLAAQQAQGQSAGIALPGLPIERHVVTDALGRQVTYYVNRPSRPAPLLLMIQGSGCDPVIVTHESGGYSRLFQFLPYAAEGRFTVLAVEKPFAGQTGDGPGGTAFGCSARFNEDFTAETWLAALRASLADARRLSWVAPGRTLLFGMSEGAVMAALLAAEDPQVTDIVSIGGSGSTQLYDFFANAYSRCFDRSACIAEVERQARAIAATPDSSTEFAWGHPHKRWSSFFRIDPGDALVRSRARVYLAFGTADSNVPPLSQELTVARLLSAGRDVTVRRVADAGHSLAPPGAQNFDDVAREYRRALDWFWARPAG